MQRPPALQPPLRVDPQAPLLLRMAVWTLISVAILFIGTASLPVPDVVYDLSGEWTLRASQDARSVHLPAYFNDIGLDPNQEAHFYRELTLDAPDPGQPWALWIEQPQYSLRVWWEGELVRQVPGPTNAPVLIVLPVEERGSGMLELEVQGDLDQGALLGRLLLAPQSALESYAAHEQGRRVGMTVGLAMLALVHLSVTAGRSFRTAHFLFGLMCLAGAVATVADASSGLHFPGGAITGLRVRLAGYAGQIGGTVAFLTAFIGRPIRRMTLGFVGLSGLVGLLTVLMPVPALPTMRLGFYGLVLGGVLWSGVLVLRAAQRSVPGSPVLALALLPVASVALINAYSNLSGQLSLLPHLVPNALWIAGASAALLVRHAAEAQRHRRLVTSSLDAMVLSDAEGGLSGANPAAARLLGWHTTQLLPRVVEADQPEVRAHLDRAVQRTDQAEFRIQHGDDPVIVESRATPVDGGRALLVLRDMSERRRLDEGMLQAARMETLGVLVGGVAHDFNNMLGSLMGHIGILQATSKDDRLLDRLDKMERSIDRASLLTRRLLTLARGTGSTLGPLALSEIARSAAELVEPTLPEGVELHLDLAPDNPSVLGAASDLEHVVVNLLVNARDAVGTRGHIWLRTRPYLHQGARGMALIVEDDGSGVPPSRKEQVFTPFFSTKSTQRGTGLGLAVARQILRDHHGRIWLEDVPGGGARFLIALRHADTRQDAHAPLPEGRRVVLVEDDEELRSTYAETLRRVGYQVRTFASGLPAWRAIRDIPPDILVSDVVMEGMDGLELARRARQRHSRLPVLLVSGFIPDEEMGGLDEDSGVSRLDKPVRPVHFVSTIGRLVRRAERRRRGEIDITQAHYIMPPLDGLTGEHLGLELG